MNKKQFIDWGKSGKEKRWPNRYRILEELKGFYGKNWRDHKFMGWSEDQLAELLATHKATKK